MKNSYDIFFSSDFDCNLMISSFFLLLCIGKSRKKHIFRGNKGVRKDSECVDVKHIYYTKKKTGFGVRLDNVIHIKLLPKKRSASNLLIYSRPCLCGSISHASTRSLDCPLNVRYLDP